MGRRWNVHSLFGDRREEADENSEGPSYTSLLTHLQPSITPSKPHQFVLYGPSLTRSRLSPRWFRHSRLCINQSTLRSATPATSPLVAHTWLFWPQAMATSAHQSAHHRMFPPRMTCPCPRESSQPSPIMTLHQTYRLHSALALALGVANPLLYSLCARWLSVGSRPLSWASVAFHGLWYFVTVQTYRWVYVVWRRHRLSLPPGPLFYSFYFPFTGRPLSTGLCK